MKVLDRVKLGGGGERKKKKRKGKRRKGKEESSCPHGEYILAMNVFISIHIYTYRTNKQ